MSQYSNYVVPESLQAIKKLPGNVRQRIKRAINDLANSPRPHGSKRLKHLMKRTPVAAAGRPQGKSIKTLLTFLRYHLPARTA
jgi:hypothetical protein